MPFFQVCVPANLPAPTRAVVANCFDRVLHGMTLDGYSPGTCGAIISAIVSSSWNPMLEMSIPDQQVGYPDEDCRNMERQMQFCIWENQERKLYIRRPDIHESTVPSPRWALAAESELGQDYHHNALRVLQISVPQLFLESSCERSTLLPCLLSSPILDCVRLIKMLSQLEGKVTISRIAAGTWTASMDKPLEHKHCLGAAIGQLVAVMSEDEPGAPVTLIVRDVVDGKLVLALAQGDVVVPPLDNFLVSGENHEACTMIFKDVEAQYSITLTAIVDLFTATGTGYTDQNEWLRPSTGLGLIEDNQMACLKVGIGFFNDKLCAQQQQAVVGILLHERPFMPYCLIGASCTGKTEVFIEATRQVASYQEETAPYEAIVHFVVPTPQEAHAVVKCLAETEIPNNSIVWLCTEDEFLITMEQLAVAPIRVDEFVLQDHHQVIVATPKALSRLPLCRENRSHPSPLLVLADSVHRISVGDFASVVTRNGEPVQVAIAGDPMQVGPSTVSKVNGRIWGRKSILDVLKLHPTFFEHKRDSNLHPAQWSGKYLDLSYTLHPKLTAFLSKTLYDSRLASFESSYLGMDADLLDGINNAGVFNAPIKGPLIWCQQSSQVARHPETLSLFNEDEASEVAKFSVRLAQAVGAAKVLVASVYPKQVQILKYLTAQNNGLLVTDLNVAQGQSREIVVISLVRSRIGSSSLRSSTPLGKLNSPHQVAALMTKGRRLVFVFGCARHFLDANNKFWNRLMTEAEWPVINDQI